MIPRIPKKRGVLDFFLHVPDGPEPVAHRKTLSADPCVSCRPHQASYQIAGRMRRESEPQGVAA